MSATTRLYGMQCPSRATHVVQTLGGAIELVDEFVVAEPAAHGKGPVMRSIKPAGSFVARHDGLEQTRTSEVGDLQAIVHFEEVDDLGVPVVGQGNPKIGLPQEHIPKAARAG